MDKTKHELTFVIDNNIEQHYFTDILHTKGSTKFNVIEHDEFSGMYKLANAQDNQFLGHVIFINPKNTWSMEDQRVSFICESVSLYEYKYQVKDSLPENNPKVVYIDDLLVITTNPYVLEYIKESNPYDYELKEVKHALTTFKRLILGRQITSADYEYIATFYLFLCKLGNSYLTFGDVASGDNPSFGEYVQAPLNDSRLTSYARMRLGRNPKKYLYNINENGKNYHIFLMPYPNNPLEVTSQVPDNVDAKILVQFNGYQATFTIYAMAGNAKEIAQIFAGANKNIFGNNYVATVKTPFETMKVIEKGLNINDK